MVHQDHIMDLQECMDIHQECLKCVLHIMENLDIIIWDLNIKEVEIQLDNLFNLLIHNNLMLIMFNLNL